MALFLILLSATDASMAVLPLQARRVEPEIAAILDDLLITELTLKHGAQVIGSGDIEAMLNLEEQKDTLGCDEVTCAAQIAGALGAGYLVTGSLSRLGDSLIVQLSLIDSKAIRVAARAKSSVPYEERYFERAVRAAVGQLLGVADSESPSVGSKMIFSTDDEELEFVATVVSASGKQFACDDPIRRGVGCTVGALPSGQARVLVSSAGHNPASDTLAVNGRDGAVVYRVDSRLSTWSWLCYTGGGAMAFTGGVSLGLRSLSDESSGFFTGLGITYLALGTGLLGLGYYLDRDVALKRTELPANDSTLTVTPMLGPGRRGAGVGATLRW